MRLNGLAVSITLIFVPATLSSWIPALGGDLQQCYEPKRRHSDPNRFTLDSGTKSWPYGPFSTRGRDIVNSRGHIITWAGVNWPMNGETMIPEGLEWQSATNILDRVKSVGFNFIRMGYAIEMVDDVYERDGDDVPLELAMILALGRENGTRVTSEIVARNPRWTAQTTRFEIWSDIADLALERGIFIHPDVHVSKAQWCCSHTDGDAWFGDYNFDIAKWLRGLAYVARWARAHPNIVSASLRNELRSSWSDLVAAGGPTLRYDWETLVGNMTAGADAVHAANPDLLITWSGMQFGEDLSALTAAANLLVAPCYKCDAVRDAHRRDPLRFDLDAHAWADKLVWELHLYDMSEDLDTGSCAVIEAELYRNGFHALGIPAPAAGCALTGDCPDAGRVTPVILSEFGHSQDASLWGDTLQDCLRGFTEHHGVSWAVWSLAGSFRIRSGVQGFADSWGLSSFDWSGWNDPDTIDEYWKPWVLAMNATTMPREPYIRWKGADQNNMEPSALKRHVNINHSWECIGHE
ncbi:glycoside hydrolase superfamily [Xylariales sp. PMI_506]|nr:glycoside hydrolase superfamily [Xylariales sp. PMI_506]